MLRTIAIAGLVLLAAAQAANASGKSSSVPVVVTLASVRLDNEIPDSIRREFDDDDGRPVRSASIDLNNDSRPEKIIPNEYLCGNGGCLWLIYAQDGSNVIGRIFGSAIKILDETSNGYRVIRTEYGLGAGVTESKTYRYHNGAYEQSE